MIHRQGEEERLRKSGQTEDHMREIKKEKRLQKRKQGRRKVKKKADKSRKEKG